MQKPHSITKLFLVFSALLFAVSVISFASAQNLVPTKSSLGNAKTNAANAGTPADDARIEKCITDKLAAASALKGDGFKVTVTNGAATLTGTTKVAGHKGGAARIAKSCGATKVANNITVAGVPVTSQTPKTSTTPAPGTKRKN